MKVGFFHAKRGDDAAHRVMAVAMIRSVRRVMPDVEIVHLTDDTTPEICGAHVVHRNPPGPLALGVLEAYAAAGDGDWLFVDTDVLVLQDVRGVFAKPFDIAVADRGGTLLEKEVGSKFMSAMPFNKGAVFSRSPAFWRAAADRLRAMKPARQEWMGDQAAMCDTIAAGRYDVSILPAAFNYPPKDPHEDLSGQAIAHFKGPRKAWMLPYLERHGR